MTDVTINRAKAVTKEEVGLLELNDLFEYRMPLDMNVYRAVFFCMTSREDTLISLYDTP